MAAMTALTLAMVTSADAWLFRRLSAASSTMANLCWCAAALIVLALYAPGAAYFALVPLVFGLVAVATISVGSPDSMRALSALALSGGLTAAFATPVIWLIYTGLTLFGAAPVLVLQVLILGAVASQLRFASPRRRWIMPAAAVVAAGSLLVAALLRSRAEMLL
jgi:hypothetical protein